MNGLYMTPHSTLAVVVVLLLLAIGGLDRGLPSGAWEILPSPLGELRAGEREILHYRHPMNPAITSPEPAKDEMGMDYIPVHAGEEEEEGVVRIAPIMMQNMNLRLDRVQKADLVRSIDAFGAVEYDEDRVVEVQVRVAGWIESLAVRAAGERVEQGQLLFEIYAPELVSAQEEFVQALRAERPEVIRAAGQRLEALGLIRGQIEELERSREVRQRVGIHAPGDGVVKRLEVREGMHVASGSGIMTLADTSTLWVIADVFDHQLEWLRPGDRAEIRIPFQADSRLEAVVDYVYPELNRQTRTVPVRLRLDNRHGEFKPGMFAAVRIDATPWTDVLSVPREAVIRTGRESRVIVHLGEGRFEARPVRIGRMTDDRMEIRDGPGEGEEVVVSGQFLIDSEASVMAASRRMASADPSMEMAKADTITSTGNINRIDREARRVNLTHPPIPELGWPEMSMDFLVAADIDLARVAAGDPVRFEMRPEPDGDGMYVITVLEADPEGGQ